VAFCFIKGLLGSIFNIDRFGGEVVKFMSILGGFGRQGLGRLD
jgi:hypothetical protein